MITIGSIQRALKWAGRGAAFAAGAYGAYVGYTWLCYGRHPKQARPSDTLLDAFIPDYDVVDRHHSRIQAPADVTFRAACDVSLGESPVVRALFKGRELVVGRAPRKAEVPGGLVDQMKASGWGVLAEIPGREIVFGAVTQPWKADVIFRSVPPETFQGFDEPGFVKIAWTLRADPIGDSATMMRTETRATTTDAAARAMFRWYWSFFSPGIGIIRRVLLAHVREDAERHRAAAVGGSTAPAEEPKEPAAIS